MNGSISATASIYNLCTSSHSSSAGAIPVQSSIQSESTEEATAILTEPEAPEKNYFDLLPRDPRDIIMQFSRLKDIAALSATSKENSRVTKCSFNELLKLPEKNPVFTFDKDPKQRLERNLFTIPDGCLGALVYLYYNKIRNPDIIQQIRQGKLSVFDAECFLREERSQYLMIEDERADLAIDNSVCQFIKRNFLSKERILHEVSEDDAPEIQATGLTDDQVEVLSNVGIQVALDHNAIFIEEALDAAKVAVRALQDDQVIAALASGALRLNDVLDISDENWLCFCMPATQKYLRAENAAIRLSPFRALHLEEGQLMELEQTSTQAKLDGGTMTMREFLAREGASTDEEG